VTFLAALHAMMDEMLARPGQRPANVREEACIAELLPQIDRASRASLARPCLEIGGPFLSSATRMSTAG
jgi:hypothetical protein